MTTSRLRDIPAFAFEIDRIGAEIRDRPEVIRLDDLHTDLAPTPAAIEATKNDLAGEEANRYLPLTGRPELKRAVAEQLRSRSGASYDPESEVVITCGGTEGMLDALLATVEPGDEVIMTDPSYAGMIARVRMLGGVPKLVPFRAESGRWRLDLDALAAATSERTSAVFLMNPSMPTGAVLSLEEWQALARLCAEREAWLIYNAAHEAVVYDGAPLVHPASVEELRPWLINVGTVSKERRMIGWRVGWVAADRRIAGDIALVHVNNTVTPTGIAQAGARAAIEAPGADLTGAIAEWQRRRDALLDGLEGLPIIAAAGGWTMVLEVAQLGHTGRQAAQALLEHDVAVAPMDDWGEEVGEGYVRLVFSAEPPQRLRLAAERLRAVL